KGQGMPAGFADDVDNVGITAETDPTVVGWVKDGESWAELKGQGMPAGFADDVDNVGITEETDPQVGAIALNSVPRWDNEKLVTSSIYYDPGNDRVGIGTPSPGYKLDVNGDAVIRGPLYLSWGDDRIQAVGGDYQPFLALHATLYPYLLGVTTVLVPTPSGFMVANWQNTRPNMHLNNDGKLLVRDFEVISDDRIKFNEQTLDYGLAQVMALEPKRFDRAEWEVDPATEEIIVHPEQTANKIGLIAQEVRQVIPEAVSIPEDENRQLWSLSYDNIVPVLVKAIQEQQAQIEALKQENQALVARYAPLESERLTDTPLTADFDGDGKADRAMVDSDGNWYVWLSGSGYSQSRL
ncbi:MAG: tail fiber domain-containing protein, partial [Verrucomicrobia bacterium]|nr:tail fiber domain-containing protein [Verrucomicrobiota bacterium]MBU4248582.1 tail fiber domain-containing protein [Verrucomicrobiota bacterium]MBU4291556.1 tail fiber domain-containing protein [Verrucomicrobiota bacterium]MBU4497363.1 tail fiber domain-containing protein [Verrucomicrobiota bacterium]MCG2679744.1 tail fiber domain-containing protein [Kiritimatiellia bacterium]